LSHILKLNNKQY